MWHLYRLRSAVLEGVEELKGVVKVHSMLISPAEELDCARVPSVLAAQPPGLDVQRIRHPRAPRRDMAALGVGLRLEVRERE